MAKVLIVGKMLGIQKVPKKSCTSGKASMVKTSSMNKHKKRSYKRYRGQGR
jgi:hypothetical protein